MECSFCNEGMMLLILVSRAVLLQRGSEKTAVVMRSAPPPFIQDRPQLHRIAIRDTACHSSQQYFPVEVINTAARVIPCSWSCRTFCGVDRRRLGWVRNTYSTYCMTHCFFFCCFSLPCMHAASETPTRCKTNTPLRGLLLLE